MDVSGSVKVRDLACGVRDAAPHGKPLSKNNLTREILETA
jgi:hypothetical protein